MTFRECIVGIVALFCSCFFAKRDDFFGSQTCQKAVAVGQTLVLCGFSPKCLWCLEVDSAFPLTHLTLLAHRLTTSGDQIFAECRILNSALFGCTAGCCDNFNILIAESLLCSHKAASTFEFAWPWYSNVPSESRSVAGSHFRNTSLGRSCNATFCSPSVEHCDEWTILTVHQSCGSCCDTGMDQNL